MTALAQSGPAATPEQTAALVPFGQPGWDGLTVAPIGLGTYLGEADADTDAHYASALRRYLRLGGNLIDTASSYRRQRSERVVGATLAAAVASGEIRREAVVVSTKGGYLSFEASPSTTLEAWAQSTWVDTGLVDPEEIVAGHCMAPAFLRHQIAQSRANLQLECLDLYYLHNPEEHLAAVGPDVFGQRLREAFATFEVAVAQGHLRAYGVASWNGLRARPGAPDYMTLRQLIETARDVAGDQHHLRVVQMPLNFQMLEAAGLRNQPGREGLAPVLAVAAEHAITVVASAPLLQGRLVGRLPERWRARFPPGFTDAQCALQFVRSTPGVTAALAGMSQAIHVEENLAVATMPRMSADAWRSVFQV